MIICALLPLAFVGVVLYLLVRGLITGTIPVNTRVYRRDLEPIQYWLGMGLCCVLLVMAVRGLIAMLQDW